MMSGSVPRPWLVSVIVLAAHASAAAPAAPAAPSAMELLHAGGAKVAVSSVVANAAIQPHDLVDGDLATAWNSRTGDLRGAWIAFRVPRVAHVTRIRLTVGFTAKGPEGDYFTLNHRVRAVRIQRLGDGADLGAHVLDPDARGLQDIAIDSPGGDFRIEVTEVVAGKRKTWRELAISELEVWGTPGPGVKLAPGMPAVAVGSLDAPALPDRDLIAEPLKSYDSIEAYCAEFVARPPSMIASMCYRGKTGCDLGAKARCGTPVAAPVVRRLPKGWTSIAAFVTTEAHLTQPHCNFAITSEARVYVLEDTGDTEACGAPVEFYDDGKRVKTRSSIDLSGELLAITLTLQESHDSPPHFVYRETLRLCGGPRPRCTPSVAIGETRITQRVEGGVGHDGMWEEIERWRLGWKLDGARLVLSRESGKLDDETKADLGGHRVRM